MLSVESDSHYTISLLEGTCDNSNNCYQLVSMIKEFIQKGVVIPLETYLLGGK